MVTIRGNGFGDATSVRFGDVEATSFNVTINVDDDTTFEGVFGDEITAVSPPHAEGSVHVTVTTPRGTSPTNDCGDSGEASAKGPPHCDRFHYYGDLRGGAWATTGVHQKGAGDEPLFLFREKTTLLLSGKVLLTGPSGAELYDPATGRWNSCPEATASADCPGPMVSARGGHTATLLKDGRVLVAGGDGMPSATAELYDPATGRFTRTAALRNPRSGHTATLLADGRVLVAGGVEGACTVCPTPNPGNASEIYNPATGQWTDAKPLLQGVIYQTATRLGSGKVLVAGGRVPQNPTNATNTDTSQLYDPALDAWTRCPVEAAATPDCPAPFVRGRYWNSSTVLSDGRILAAGGVKANGVMTHSTAELYDPRRGVWTETGRMGEARFYHLAARLPNGRVLVAGGGGRYGNGRYQPVSSAELYDPATSRWSQAPFMPDAQASTGVALATGPWAACASNCGKVLVIRGGPDVPSLLFSPTPEVAGVSPASGPALGGTAVAITGTGLASVSSVKFGGVEAQRIEPDGENPDGKLVAVSPAHAPGAVDVTITTDGGKSAAVPAARFTYVQGTGTGSGTGTGLGGGGTLTEGTTPGTAQGGKPAPVGPPSAGERSALGRCLVKAKRQRTRSRRRAARRRCLLPGRVRGLKARARSASKIKLTFSAPSSVGRSGPPAGRFVVKQSPRPIKSERDFGRARTLCKGVCRFGPTRVGQRVTLTVTGLRPRARYYYAVKAVGASGRKGPRSKTARATTRGTKSRR